MRWKEEMVKIHASLTLQVHMARPVALNVRRDPLPAAMQRGIIAHTPPHRGGILVEEAGGKGREGCCLILSSALFGFGGVGVVD